MWSFHLFQRVWQSLWSEGRLRARRLSSTSLATPFLNGDTGVVRLWTACGGVWDCHDSWGRRRWVWLTHRSQFGVVEGNEASHRTRHQSALFRATHKNKWVIWFNKYTPVFSTRAVRVMCSLCYVIHPSVITLFTKPCRVQLMRSGSSKVKDSLRCEPHLQKPKKGRVTLWGVC